MEFKDLLIKHSYYCSDSNYYSTAAYREYDTFKEFYNETNDANVDMNMCFRFDIHPNEEDGDTYYGKIFIMQQRKGKFIPFTIKSIVPSDFNMVQEYLSKHWKYIKELWLPFSRDLY